MHCLTRDVPQRFCGEDWLENYREYMSEHDRSCIVEKPSTATFTFGDGKRVSSSKILTLPCYINGRRSTVDTDVVTCNIPLLLSKKAMKKGKMILNFEKDALTVGNNVVSIVSHLGTIYCPFPCDYAVTSGLRPWYLLRGGTLMLLR